MARYKYMVQRKVKILFCKLHSTDSTEMFSGPDIIKKFDIMIVTIFVTFGECDLVANCLADLFLYSYDEYFIKGPLKKKRKQASPNLYFHVQLYRRCLFTK